MPFHSLRDVKLEQPIFGANYLHGKVIADPGGNWNGEADWKLTFNKGCCIDFGQALLKANDMGRLVIRAYIQMVHFTKSQFQPTAIALTMLRRSMHPQPEGSSHHHLPITWLRVRLN